MRTMLLVFASKLLLILYVYCDCEWLHESEFMWEDRGVGHHSGDIIL